MTIRWKGYLGGNPGADLQNTIAFVLPEGKQPNWFHRQMQYLMIGIYWVREPPSGMQREVPEERADRRQREDKGGQHHRNFGIGH